MTAETRWNNLRGLCALASKVLNFPPRTHGSARSSTVGMDLDEQDGAPEGAAKKKQFTLWPLVFIAYFWVWQRELISRSVLPRTRLIELR